VIASDRRAGAVIARIADNHNHHAGRDALLKQVDEALAKADGDWFVGGIPVIRTEYVRLLQRDSKLLVPLAIVVSTLFFIIGLRDWRHVLACSFTISLGGGLAVSALLFAGHPLTFFSPALIAVVLVVSTSDIVHLVHRFADHHARTGSTALAIESATREVSVACFLTSLTTAIGFSSLLLTDLPNIRTFGAFTGIGVMMAFITTFIVLPPLLAHLGPPRHVALERAKARQASLERFGRWVLDRKRAALGSGIIVALVAGFGVTQIKIDHRILEDVRASSRVAMSQDFLEARLGSVLPLDVIIERPDAPIRDPVLLEALEVFQQTLRSDEMVGHVVGLTDLVARGWQALGEEGLPSTLAAVSQVLLLCDLVDPDLVPSLQADEHSTRIRTRVQDRGHDETVALVDRIRRAAAPLEALGATVQVTGVAWLAQEVNSTLTTQFAGSFGLALVAIACIAFIRYRSLRRVAIALIPNALPILVILGILGWTGITLKPSTAMVLSVGLGIAIDDTLHFLTVYERGRNAGLDAETAVLGAYGTAGRSMVDTSVVIALGFLIFAMSEFVALTYFGTLNAICVVVAVYADLLLLGPLLVKFDR
jgi:predicted RND superfamily exporter protein